MRRFPAGVVAAVAVGGAVGTILRAALARALPPPATGFPLDTFLVNVIGCLVLGLVVVAAMERGTPSPYFRPLVGTGFCGGMTTFSTLVVETDLLIKAGAVGLAFGYLAASLVAGLAATRLGMVVARWI
jgi:CrcB protein